MKAQCDLQMATKQMDQKMLKGKVNKERDVSGEEMQSLLCKLKTLVPNMPRHKKLSKLEIIQYVIDYIMDLQIALETHPAATRPNNAVLSGISPNRQPLGVLSPSINTCAAQEVTQSEKIPIVDVISANRPVSC
ncbi:DNA-binding protein inhibitor ID-2-like [Argiope bruennichi]|uniref:DNA-binding protein inhibitor ID-2 like protein n=1 Tax=Argiope bruennichi TaxID=94029 RepID=A0A8T0EW43_ARGBR|nr:DNA-binding protein inhibitor ID-2-like [Argiope bruennichi]KAF8782533.1 DNA-binding protein inhibitor ID-2 like protein [Argiope bruennichi]